MSDILRAPLQVIAAVIIAAACALAQPQGPDAPDQPAGAGGEISFNFPDNVPLKTFVEYAAGRLGLNIIYDDQILDQRLTIRSPAPIPSGALQPLLENVLRMKGLALVDAEQPGWKRIVPVAAAARPKADGAAAADGAFTQVLRLRHANPQQIEPLIKPLLTTPGGSALAIPEQGLLVVTDFAPAIARISDLVQMVDQPSRDVVVEFAPVKHADAAQLATQISQLVGALRSSTGLSEGQASPVSVAYDARTNQVVIIGEKSVAAQARQMIDSLDVPVLLERNPVRFYKLANTTASEVLATIQALAGTQRGAEQQGVRADSPPSSQDAPTLPATDSAAPVETPADSTTPREMRDIRDTREYDLPRAADAAPRSRLLATPVAAPQAVHVGGVKIASDPHTNTIIVEGDAAAQRSYEALIRQLDKRRPQVLIEATVVTLDTNDDFSLGVEFAVSGGDPDERYLIFSSFGLSNVSNEGRLAIIPGLGFNGALISSDIADIIIRALQQNSRAKVTAAPRILVNDNSTGSLISNQEQPFTSNNFNNTVSTTTFGGYAEAGTEITVTPHISESDYLQLEYSVSLSNFTDQSSDPNIPPPRQTNLVQSRVTIPDGSTIIVGGLNRQNYMRTVRSIPLLGDIPYLKYLFSDRSIVSDRSTLFIFIRPTILRDDSFADLKFLSERDLADAEMPGDFPSSEPIEIH